MPWRFHYARDTSGALNNVYELMQLELLIQCYKCNCLEYWGLNIFEDEIVLVLNSLSQSLPNIVEFYRVK